MKITTINGQKYLSSFWNPIKTYRECFSILEISCMYVFLFHKKVRVRRGAKMACSVSHLEIKLILMTVAVEKIFPNYSSGRDLISIVHTKLRKTSRQERKWNIQLISGQINWKDIYQKMYKWSIITWTCSKYLTIPKRIIKLYWNLRSLYTTG